MSRGTHQDSAGDSSANSSAGKTAAAPLGGPREPVHPQPPTPDGERPKKERSNLVLRLVTAGIGIPLVCGVIWAGGLWVLGLIVVLTLIGVNEFYHLIEAKGAEHGNARCQTE